MTAYYNEIDRFNCDWLQLLMDNELITPGKIDDRSIVDVRPDDLAGYERVHFFAGIGGWDLSLNLAGCSEPVWTGSCPCQPFSLAGKQKGFADDRHLWPHFRELIRVGRPATVFGEQVASAADWLRLVRGDLEAMGYAVGAIPIEAASAGADHLRDRYWFVAHADQLGASEGRQQRSGQFGRAGSDPQARDGDVGNAIGARTGRDSGGCGNAEATSSGERNPDGRGGDASQSPSAALDWVIGADGKARRVKPGIRLLAHGIPNRVGLLRGFGNAIDPRPAAAFIEAAMNSISPQESR